MSSLDYGTLDDDDDWMKMMESSSEKFIKLKSSCCRCCVGFTFTLSLTALFLWLSTIPSAPVIYLSYKCYVDATGTGNTTVVYVALNPTNTIMVKEIYYDHFNVSLSYHSFHSGYDINLGYNDSASELHQGYPMKYPSHYDEYSPNVTFFSKSKKLKDEMASSYIKSRLFNVEVAVTWRIMNRKEGHKMVVRGSFSVERSNYWYLYGNNPAILTIKWPVSYLSTSWNRLQ